MENKKVMIVNDIAGAGKVAANVVFPILSAAELEPVILPTLLLSSNADAAVGEAVTLSTQDIFVKYLEHWDELEFDFSAFVTGYFAETEQIDQFKNYFLEKKKADASKKLFVDPTMGDSGLLYPGFNEEVPQKLSELIRHADLVKPNITEACYLTGHPYKDNMGIEEMTELAHKVNDLGAKNTVLTGLRGKDEKGQEQMGFLYYDENGNNGVVMHRYFDQDFFGTGDIVFSLMTTFYLAGHSLQTALEETAELTETALQKTVDTKRKKRYGVYFESMFADLYQKLHS